MCIATNQYKSSSLSITIFLISQEPEKRKIDFISNIFLIAIMHKTKMIVRVSIHNNHKKYFTTWTRNQVNRIRIISISCWLCYCSRSYLGVQVVNVLEAWRLHGPRATPIERLHYNIPILYRQEIQALYEPDTRGVHILFSLLITLTRHRIYVPC